MPMRLRKKYFPPGSPGLWRTGLLRSNSSMPQNLPGWTLTWKSSTKPLPRTGVWSLPGPSRFSIPLQLTYPRQGSILFETANSGHDEAIGALNNIILRLLSTAPPGRLNFTIIDPVGLGQNFAGVMHLADYEERSSIAASGRSAQIEQRLAELSEHIEKVIQMYLRNEYATITEYNEQAGSMAEKYHFLVVARFPGGLQRDGRQAPAAASPPAARVAAFTR